MLRTVAMLAAGVAALGFNVHAEQLTYGTYFKAAHNIIKDGVKPYLDGVTEQTGGAITFKYLTDGTVVGASTTAKGVQQGLVDMGTVIPIYASSTFPMSSLLSSLPIFKTDSLIETGAMNELFFLNCEECQPEWKSSRIVPFAMYASSPYYLQCSKEIRSLEDAKGRRIQGTGEFGALATALGALPMGLTATELYTGMSQGTLDCIIGTVAWLETYGLKDVVKYVTDVPLGVFRPVSHMNMNERKWNRLTQEQQRAFIDGLAKLVADSAYGYVEEDQVGRRSGLAAGIKFAPPFEGFTNAFEKVGDEGGRRFLELAKSKGMKNPERLLERYLELQNAWREIVANSKAKSDYEAALHERIFSKVAWPTK